MTYLYDSAKESLFISDQLATLPILPMTYLDHVTNTFEPISLREMDAVALLNRVETKYVLSTTQILTALQNLQSSYRILSIEHQRIHSYRTLYFDTNGFKFFHDQVTGRSDIYKVRSREYLETQLSYLEVKHKNQKRRTNKNRLLIAFHESIMTPQAQAFLGELIPPSRQSLEPKLWNTFERITLVNLSDLERITIDMNLRFFTEQQELSLGGIVIAEIKQEKFSKGSAFMSEMRRQGIRKTGFSKYCFGVSQLYSTVKKNSQKEKLLMIEKLQHGGQSHVYYA